MQTYKKYILRLFIPTFLIISLIITSLVWITRSINMLYLVDKGIGFTIFFKLTFLLIPSLLFITIPLITLISILYVYKNLQNEQQLIILRTSGMSNHAIAKPALTIAWWSTIFVFIISFLILPWSYGTLKYELNNFSERYVSNIIEEKTFNQLSKSSTIYVSKKNFDGSFKGVVLFDNKAAQNKTIYFAKNGKVITSKFARTEFVLNNGVRHTYDKNGNITKLHFESLAVVVSSLSKKDSDRDRTSQERYLHELFYPDDSISLEKQKRFIIDGHFRIIWPLFNIVFTSIALSLFLISKHNLRVDNIKSFILIAIVLIIITYIHFNLQKQSYTNFTMVYYAYLNLFISYIVSKIIFYR